MPWQIVHVPDKPPSSPELSTVDVLASVIEPKLANTLVRKLNQICPLENLRHVKRVQKRSVEGKVELSVILCRQNEHESLCAGMPNDVLQLASTYQLSPYKTKVAKYAALSKEEWKEQSKLWPTSYHPSTIPYEVTGFAEEESQLIVKYMKFAMRLMTTPNGKVVNAAVIVDPLGGKIIASGNDQTLFRLPTNETISNCINGSEQSATTFSFQHGGDSLGNIPEDSKSKLLPCDFSRVSCMYPWRWTEPRSDNGKEKCDGNFSWHPLRHATLVSIENAAARDRQLFPCLEYQNNLPLRNGVCDCSENNPIKRQKIQLSENAGVISEDASPENLPSEVLRPYLCTGFDIYILWEPCVMCAMALVHQRIRRIFYAFPNPIAGALGSVYNLQGEKSLNHHYSVFRIQIPEE
ncbi:hypothetical protein KFK09_009684 [Dendrobium nobile]|uniref:CMP/dCMP-type deaminase domain-containing protein n=1 Tax=Dendrobium nobile TaxID=94219 RepID=A0A8T3BI43_DENNO|nr:hypothetical protein KFK09_009684 [Dendrobium nobile]